MLHFIYHRADGVKGNLAYAAEFAGRVAQPELCVERRAGDTG